MKIDKVKQFLSQEDENQIIIIIIIWQRKINQTIIITQKENEIKFVNEKKIRKNLG